MFDRVYSGPIMTWCNNRLENTLMRKLDRILINHRWLDFYAGSSVKFLLLGVSDHCLAMANLDNRITLPRRPFKFLIFGLDTLIS